MVGACDQRLTQLQDRLTEAIRTALPITQSAEEELKKADSAYGKIAAILVELRHQFPGSEGQPADLRGRSSGYRQIVRSAYTAAGAAPSGPVQKRITAGVAYWVRKLLVDRYGEDALREIGVLAEGSFASVMPSEVPESPPYEDPAQCLSVVVGLLNKLAVDPTFIPSEDAVRSAARAVALLERKLASQRRAETVRHSAA